MPTLTASYTGFVNGDTSASLTTQPTLTTTATASSHVRQPYAITASGAVDADYTISYVAGTLTVTPAALTITANNQTKVYGAALPTLTASYTRLRQWRHVGQPDHPAHADHDGHRQQPCLRQPLHHHRQRRGGHRLHDQLRRRDASPSPPAALTITANNQTKVYGAALPTLTASYSGFVNGDTSASLTTQPTLSTTATAASHVAGSPYTITASGAVDTDYTHQLRGRDTRPSPRRP